MDRLRLGFPRTHRDDDFAGPHIALRHEAGRDKRAGQHDHSEKKAACCAQYLADPATAGARCAQEGVVVHVWGEV
jgi:hypothetical protein